MIACWLVGAFVCGSLPLSLWAGRLLFRVDVRDYGDHNPGATNAWRARGWRLGVPALLLDYLKGAGPVTAAHLWGRVEGWWMLPVAVAPALGSAFSPFLRFRGGKSVAVTFGIWTGLTLGHAPIVLGALLGLFTAIQTADAWTVVLASTGLLLHLLLLHAGPVLGATAVATIALLLWTHRAGLGEPIRLRRWHLRLFRVSD